jgi:general secretion pathway protein A
MYCEFFGLSERPFNLTPDTGFLYPSKAHKEVLTHLLYGVNSRCGFILVTGEVGAGKTTLCRVLLNQLDENTKVAFVLNSFLTEFELLRAINQDFGLPSKGRTKMDLLDDLNAFLLKQNRHGHNVAIIVDEAQNLSFAVLEQIRMLSNLETEKEKLLQIVLVGQPELRRKLASTRLRQLSQRITVRYHLTPLSREDVRSYIYYRLKVAGSHGDVVFTRAALDEIAYVSGGVPRLVNVVADRALMVGYVRGSHRITRAMVCQAARETTGQRRSGGLLGTFFSMRLSVPRVAMALLWAIPFAAVAVLGTIGSARARIAQIEDGRTLALAAQRSDRPQVAMQAPESTLEMTPEVTPDVTPEAPVERRTESASSIARVVREEGGGAALGAPLSSLRATTPLRTTYVKPDIDFTPPAKNFTPATVAAASYSSFVEPVVQLLLYWKVPAPVAVRVRSDWAGRSDVDLAEIARACRLGAAQQACSFDELLEWDLPAVIAIKHEDGTPHYITLLSVKDDTATVYIKSKRVVVFLSAVRELYDGTAIFFASDTFVNSVRLDDKIGLSLDVRKLQDYLKALKYFGGSPSGWYAPDTQAAVLQFQSDYAIKPTGVADAATKLRLYTLAPPEGIPHLKQ